MATGFTDIYDLFMMLNSDYRLLALYQNSVNDFNTYVEGWLIFAVDEFSSDCAEDLTYSTTTQTFTATLSQEVKNILAELMVKYWLQKTVQDVLQMNNNIQDHDFKTYSQAQNLDSKRQYYNVKREEVSQKIMDYAYRHTDWTAWKLQNFDGSV